MHASLYWARHIKFDTSFPLRYSTKQIHRPGIQQGDLVSSGRTLRGKPYGDLMRKEPKVSPYRGCDSIQGPQEFH
jgi:hypothetical protein